MARSLEWMKLTAAEVQAAAAEDALLIVPVASLEQHGPALVTGTDIILGGNVALETARKLVAAGHPALVTPVVWHGLAEHHMAFGGTVTLDSATFQAVLRHVVKSAARHGFRRVFLLNGHGGNAEAIGTAATDLAVEFGIHVGGGTYWHMVPEVIAPLLQDQPTLMHACEAETSMVWSLLPEGVRPDRLPEAHGPASTRVAGQPPGLLMRRSFKELTPTGVVGDARRASPEKGAALLDAIAAKCAELLANPAIWGRA
ncbi:creatininase family protein [Roseococcus sp. SDR]|uniref:creatininase family protein n=1 Tax=Roseococcus sp. SDR TaxID=2835532 RepID=UPI001BD09837|nr:creatininase family protein [Roseococcus sp. SDR]MBS7788485.1 creatininase family protein [Roseococcus sp. SDR]MBV1843799.1 creatininase family protein [Roseococcus sp. SDR]